ncbi:MAG: CHAP domain-containing protein [Eubacterium sp.]|nr:CHAP domain-containing protein [Eubacterium sp.]
MMTVKFSKWVEKYLGRKTDFDGAYGVQCVDLVDCYIRDVLELEIGFWGNAKDWWLDRNYSQWLKDNFVFVTPKYYDGELKTGDIGIRTSGTYGHIFIVKEPAKNGKLSYYDQNATGNGDAMTLRTKPFTSAYINGVLRPKNQKNLKGESTVSQYGDAKMKSGERTYADSDLTMRVGYVDKYERVYYLGTGEGNPIITYKTSTGYKVGFVRRNSVIRD